MFNIGVKHSNVITKMNTIKSCSPDVIYRVGLQYRASKGKLEMSEKDKFSGERSSMDFLGPPLGSLQASVWENLRAMKKQNRLLRYKAVEEVMSPLINQVILRADSESLGLFGAVALRLLHFLNAGDFPH